VFENQGTHDEKEVSNQSESIQLRKRLQRRERVPGGGDGVLGIEWSLCVESVRPSCLLHSAIMGDIVCNVVSKVKNLQQSRELWHSSTQFFLASIFFRHRSFNSDW
jgi:hypothetical protein